MKEAEASMHEQFDRDKDCTLVASEILKMRNVMSHLVRERSALALWMPLTYCAGLRRIFFLGLVA